MVSGFSLRWKWSCGQSICAKISNRARKYRGVSLMFLTDLCAGMNYTPITDNLIVGSQPQKPEDIDHLKQEEKVAYVLNLQQDKDVEYWGIDLQSIIKRCQELGIRHMRRPVSGIFF